MTAAVVILEVRIIAAAIVINSESNMHRSSSSDCN